MCYATKHLKVIENTLKEIKKDWKELGDKLSVLDIKISDVYHDLETRTFNAAEGFYIARDLQLLLQQRRVIKGELSRLQALESNLNYNHLHKQVNIAVNKINKKVQSDKQYMSNFKDESFLVLQ